jgi:cell division septation protein DedD
MTQEVEKEIVLGNKQLISLFFVVVALCGVFFALGYMMGGNKAKPATSNLEASAAVPNASTISPAPATAAQDSEPPRETAPDPAAEAAPVEPASTAGAPTAVSSTPTVQTRPALETPVASDSGAMWLQVTALKRDDADKLVKTLREQNLPAVVAASSKPDLFRVLVGPYHQTVDLAEAKARLKGLGFANAFVQK